MKNMKAIGLAFVMFLVTVTVVKIASAYGLPGYNIKYGTWISSTKFGCNSGMKKLLKNDNVFTVFGSSELKHCQSSGFHADSIFKDTDITPVFIGKGGCQSLNHAITLGAVGQELSGKKVVISISPQWFKPNGVSKNAFGSFYSETNMIAFLQNETISEKTKQYVIDRVKSLTDENPVMWNRVQDDVKWYKNNEGNMLVQARKGIHSAIANYKAETKLYLVSVVKGYFKKTNINGKDEISDWSMLYKKAEKKGSKISGHNPYGMYDQIYKSRYQKKVKKRIFKNLSYSVQSKEFDDLQCFLDICREENIEALMIMQPLNGRWADDLNFPTEKRQELYDKVKALAAKNNVQLADLSGMEYDEYTFEDDSHLALKGLVCFNEQIYNFYKQNKK